MKRAFDAAASAIGLLVLSPVLLVVAIAIKLDSRGPVLYRQRRVGRGGREFLLLKFRSMVTGADRASRLTTANDARVTRVGRFLRASNLDELPQLLNVLAGHMSLVGPRPEVPEFVDLADPRWQEVLSVRPGMTSPESIEYRREGEILATFGDHERGYREAVLPAKLELAARYVRSRTFWGDVGIILRTFAAIARGPTDPATAEAGATPRPARK